MVQWRDWTTQGGHVSATSGGFFSPKQRPEKQLWGRGFWTFIHHIKIIIMS